MGLLDFLFGSQEDTRDERKRVFISFAIEDEVYRDHLVNQGRNARSPFEFIDMSVKEPYMQREWQQRCRTKIKRCHGVIVLLSKSTYHSSGTRWEIKCAKEEGLPIIGMHIRKNEKGAIQPELKGKKIIEWTWGNVDQFIKKL